DDDRAGRAGMFNPGPHGFSEVLYAVTSAANNNGTALAMMTAPAAPGCSTLDRTALAKCCTPSPRRPITT
ncbi:hypothetical protein CJ738_36590, partial [Klebsiella pneumoniae]